MLSGRDLCDKLITRPEESYRRWCVVVCDLETSRIGAPYIYDISSLRVKNIPDRKRSVGEPRKGWLDDVKNDLKKIGVTGLKKKYLGAGTPVK